MAQEYIAKCKDCGNSFGYSEASLQTGNLRGLSRPERCPECRRIHSRESRSIGIPQIKVKPTGPRKPDKDLTPGRLGKISHPERMHRSVQVEGKFGRPDVSFDFGISDDDIRELIRTLDHHQVTVIVGPTGSGKSTFLPYRLMVPPEGEDPDVFTRYGQIVITQPRIQATRNIARFVSEDLHGSSLGAGFDVGFRHSNAPMSDWRNKLVYITDGTLINWIVTGQIANLSVIMIDEAHERSLNIDLILGLLKQQLPRFPHLKLIIASATINAALFQNFFGGPQNVPLLQFRGLKQHRVEAYFPHHDAVLKNDHRVPGVMASKIEDILQDIARGIKKEGDVLGFLPGKVHIEKCVSNLQEKIAANPELREKDIQVYPLYSQLPQKSQDLALMRKVQVIRDKILYHIEAGLPDTQDRILALLLDRKSVIECEKMVKEGLKERQILNWSTVALFAGTDKPDSYPRQVVFATHEDFEAFPNRDAYYPITDRRVIISTNVAETSLTVDGIVYVVDSALVRESRWVAEEKANELPIIFHSRAGCRQRWGRAGRVRDGEAHMLYTDVQFEEAFPPYTVPEVMRSSLDQVVLKAKAAGIDDITSFDWIEKPEDFEIDRSSKMLREIGALDEDGDLSHYGVELGSIISEVPISNLLIVADQFACGLEMATFAALVPLKIRGGLFLWDRNWDFTTKKSVENIRHNLAAACRDDLEFLLKLHAIQAESPDHKTREILSRLFFLNEDEFNENVATARDQFLEMLSIGKKAEEDRPVIFGFLDRLRMILAFGVPEDNIYIMQDNKKVPAPYYGEWASLPICIEEDTAYQIIPGRPFIALKKRIDIQEGEKHLLLSGLVDIEESWLSYRNKSVMELAAGVSKVLQKAQTEPEGLVRHRVMLDVSYPIGACYTKKSGSSTPSVPGQLLHYPDPIEPIIPDRKATWPQDALHQAKTDVDPWAGWDDKSDKSIPSDPEAESYSTEAVIEEDLNEGNNISIDDEDESDLQENLVSANAFEITTDEFAAVQDYSPNASWPTKEGQTDACEVIGHDYSDPTNPTLLLSDFLRDEPSATIHPNYSGGQIIRVKPMSVETNTQNEMGLRVQDTETDLQFIVDAANLTFSGRAAYVPEFMQPSEIEMIVEAQKKGTIRLSALPLAEKNLHIWLKSINTRREKTVFEAKCVEAGWQHCNFAIKTTINEAKGQVLGAHLKKREDDKTHYQVGSTYRFYLHQMSGQNHIDIGPPPEGLLDFVEKEKLPRRIFWNAPKRRLHTKEPMSSDTLQKLLDLSDSTEYRMAIQKLYCFSNALSLEAATGKPKGPGPLERGKTDKERFFQSYVPAYEVGEKVSCTITSIFDHAVNVVLAPGGTGQIPKGFLCIEKLLDPRERVYADQQLEATVVSQNGDKITLTLISEDDIDFKTGQICDATVGIVKNTYVLAKLEPGINGIIPIKEVNFGYIEDIHQHLKTGQKIKVKIIGIKLDHSDPKSPLKITLSIKKALPRLYLKIADTKIGLLIGRKGSTIKTIKEKSKCNIDCKNDGTIEIIGKEKDLLTAAELIREIIPEAEAKDIKHETKPLDQ